MRVLHLIAPGALAGAERVVLAGGRGLQDLGISVTVGALVDARAPHHGEAFLSAAEAAGNHERLAVPCRGRLDATLASRLGETFAQNGWDVVHAHGYKPLSYTLLGRALSIRQKTVVVATHHGNTSASSTVRFYERLLPRLYARSDGVFAVSHDTLESLAAAGVSRKRLHLVENPATIRHLEAPPAGPFRLVFAGRLVHDKGLDLLLKSLSEPRLASVELDVLGEGPDRKALELQAAGLGPRVRFHGWVPDVGPFLARAHAAVLPSRREGLPMAVLEALGAGRPVLATRVGGVGDVVVSGQNGLLVSPDDVHALTDAAVRMLSDSAGFLRRAADAVPALDARLGPAVWARKTFDLYDHLVESAAAALRVAA